MTDAFAISPLEQARILSEALPHMQQYDEETIVIKYGGHAMGAEDLAKAFARDIVLLEQTAINPVVVHGGGPQIGRMLDKLKIESKFVDGLRVTDEATVEIVEMVLSGSINKQIVAAINAVGGQAVGLSGKDANLIRADRLKRTKKDPDSNIEKVLDLGLVGTPSQVSPAVLTVLAENGITPVIAPIAVGPDGETLNINADTAAGAIAAAVGASRLFMLTDVAGVLDADGNLVSEMTVSQARASIADGSISGGMIPKVETCLEAMEGGAEAAVILDGRAPHGILIEMFTPGGAGTLIQRDG